MQYLFAMNNKIYIILSIGIFMLGVINKLHAQADIVDGKIVMAQAVS
jgi:hypothetical protein